MSAFGEKPTWLKAMKLTVVIPAQIFSSPINRAGFPTIAGQRRNLHAMDESALEGWIKVAHRLFIEVDDTTRPERPDIVYFNDGSLVGDFNESVCGPVIFAMPDATKRLA